MLYTLRNEVDQRVTYVTEEGASVFVVDLAWEGSATKGK